MQVLDGRLVLSPTDLVGHLACEHLTQLELAAARGLRIRPERVDPELDVLSKRGLEHEALYLAQVEAEGRTLAVIDAGKGLDDLEAAGLVESIGTARIYPTLPTAVQAYLAWHAERHGRTHPFGPLPPTVPPTPPPVVPPAAPPTLT